MAQPRPGLQDKLTGLRSEVDVGCYLLAVLTGLEILLLSPILSPLLRPGRQLSALNPDRDRVAHMGGISCWALDRKLADCWSVLLSLTLKLL